MLSLLKATYYLAFYEKLGCLAAGGYAYDFPWRKLANTGHGNVEA